MSQYVPDGEMVGEGVEVPWNEGSIEAVRDVEGGTPEEVEEHPDVDAGPVVDNSPLGGGDESSPLVERAERVEATAPAVDVERQLAERTEDLQRLQAEYVNYKRRVDRDRDLARTKGIEAVMVDLLPVLDAITLAGEHDELTGGPKLIAEEIGRIATKYGVEAYAEVGDAFDPQVHDALMQVPGEPGQTEPLVGQVLQRGYRLGDRIVRHARVAVAEPGN